VGTALVQEVLEEARRAAKAVRIHVERGNPALRLYERLGFRLLEDRGVYLFLEARPRPAAAD
jgi:ribosomal protein S18 acetylase RimI-like enzyme